MRITNSFFNAQRSPHNPLIYRMPPKSITDSLFNAMGSRQGGPFAVAAPKGIDSAYDFAEFEEARSSVKCAFQKAEIDDETERNALWALNQLEAVVHAPKVLAGLDGNLSFEWGTDQGFGLLQIGPTHYSYHVKPIAGGPITGGGDAQAVNPGIGTLLDAVIYPTPLTPWMADPAVSRLGLGCVLCTDGFAVSCDTQAGESVTLASEVNGVLALSGSVEFEDGIENEFTERVTDLVRTYGARAVDGLVDALHQGRYNPETIAQVLLCFARIQDPRSYSARSRAVRNGLSSSSAKVRDAAIVAIDSMLDKSAEDDLRIAIQREQVPSLKQDMASVLEYLQSAA